MIFEKKIIGRGGNRLEQLNRELGVGDTAEKFIPNGAEMFGDGKRERKVKCRGGWNENVKSIDAGERRGDRRCMKKKEQREFQKLEITCCRKHVLLSGLHSWKPGKRRLGRWEQTVTPPPAKCLQSGTGRGAPQATGTLEVAAPSRLY